MAYTPPKYVAWSYSRIKDWRECPYKLYLKSIAPPWERIAYVSSPAAAAGTAVDDALTARIGQHTPLPAQYARFEEWARAVESLPGLKTVQYEMAFDYGWNKVGPRDWDKVWLRNKLDVAIINGKHAAIWDWKNGMVMPDEEQTKLYAASGFLDWPEVEVIDASYVWLQHGRTSDYTYTRDQVGELWNAFLPDVQKMQLAYETKRWEPTPAKGRFGWNCKRCEVNREGKCKVAAVKYEAWK